ncbi:MAG: TonB-dependent receptor [Alphaproteobacteria bacterium]|nr:TonB-dependent receptor [Alphaproteobacteria bacterium]
MSHAQSNWVRGEETVVTAQLLREPLADVLPSVSVITREDIQRAPASDLYELINGLPGIDATRTGPPGNPITVSMRGASGAQTLVLVDGMPFSAQGTIGGLSPFEAIPLGLIRRIEILRGNASAQYGPGAVGGVINIMTTTDDDGQAVGSHRTSATVASGRFGQSQWSAGMSFRGEETRLQFSVGQNESKGYDALIPSRYSTGGYAAHPGPNGYRQEFYNLGLTRQFGRQTELGLRLTHTRLKAEFDNAYADRNTDVWDNKTQVNFMGLYLKHQVNSDWMTRLQYSQSLNQQSTFTNGAFNLSYGSFDSSHQNWQWDNTVALSDRHMLTAGANSAKVQLDAQHTGYVELSPGIYGEIPVLLRPSIQTRRVYTGVTSLLGRVNTQLTLSRDELGQGISSDNFLLGAGYSLGQGYKLTATRSSALLAPTVGQRYDPSFGGNPTLLPERSFSNEAGLQFQSDTFKWRLVAFQVRYANLISMGSTLVSDPFWRRQGVSQLENIGQARNQGYEWGSTWRSGPWMMGLGLTWQEPENQNSTIKPLNKAKRFGNLRLGYQLNAETRLTWVTYGSSDRFTLAPGDSATSPTRTSGYSLHHWAAEHRLSKQLNAKFSLINAFDKAHSTVAGYAPQPRTWLLSLSYQSD